MISTTLDDYRRKFRCLFWLVGWVGFVVFFAWFFGSGFGTLQNKYGPNLDLKGTL